MLMTNLVLGAFGVAVAASLQTAGVELGTVSNPTVAVETVQFQGSAAVRVTDRRGPAGLNPLVELAVGEFHNGTIELDVAGAPAAGVGEGARGFVGVAFRIDPAKRYEALYIRPTNGRADDQLRRNHATQYVSMPEYPWHRLRKEQPGVYESYADMVAGEWTRLRVEVSGAKARLYVNGAAQPALIVNDLKLGGDAKGGVALWVGDGTQAHFRNVRVTKR